MLKVVDQILPQRYWAWAGCGLLTAVSLLLSVFASAWLWVALVRARR